MKTQRSDAEAMESISEKLKGLIDDETLSLNEFTREMAGSKVTIHTVLSWADTAFESAAQIYVYSIVHGAIAERNAKGNPILVDELRNYCTEQVLRSNKRRRSSSVCSDLMDDCIAEAWSQIVDLIKWEGI